MDAAEFKQQFLPYHRKLYRTAFRLTENPQEAEDMVQEAYLKLWNKRDELAGVLNTEAYCVTLASPQKASPLRCKTAPGMARKYL